MPYVKCPSCELVSYSAAAYATLECCAHCGAGLPLRKTVVSASTIGGARTRVEPWHAPSSTPPEGDARA